MFQGFIISVIFSLIIYVVLFLGYPFQNQFQKQYLFFLFIPILVIGTILGGIGKTIYTNRYKKLFLIGLILVYWVAFIYSSLVVFSDFSDVFVNSEKFFIVLKLSAAKFFFFGFFTLPVLSFGVFLIELWSHPRM